MFEPCALCNPLDCVIEARFTVLQYFDTYGFLQGKPHATGRLAAAQTMAVRTNLYLDMQTLLSKKKKTWSKPLEWPKVDYQVRGDAAKVWPKKKTLDDWL